MLNVRNLLYRPSLILLGRPDYAGETGLDLSTTLTCARFCVTSAKDTIQLLHSTASRLTGAFWYNIFCTFRNEPTNVDIYTAATVLLGARLCLKKGELDDIEEDWALALSYLKRISSKSISAERCLKVLEVMHSQLNSSPKSTQNRTPREMKSNVTTQPITPNFDPLAPPLTTPGVYSGNQSNVIEWDMQDLVWSNLPWDFTVTDDSLMDSVADTGFGWGAIAQMDNQIGGDGPQQGGETMGMPVL
jgi:hypothetical protein